MDGLRPLGSTLRARICGVRLQLFVDVLSSASQQMPSYPSP